MMKRHSHLSDDRLVEMCLDGTPVTPEQQHLDVCLACEARRAEFARILADCALAATADADAAFPPDRLARQQSRILQRIEHDGRPARVIAFPAGHPHEPALHRSRPGMRWLAGAAAAGLVIGILAGHLAHDVSFSGLQARPSAPAAGAVAAPASTIRTVSTTLGEEEFLGRLERAVERSSGPALRPLDDMTPLVWEVAAR
jgi:hypothetical protein